VAEIPDAVLPAVKASLDALDHILLPKYADGTLRYYVRQVDIDALFGGTS